MTVAPVDNGRSGSVLLVDDDAATVEHLATLLGRIGFTSRAAADGVEALSEAAKEMPSLVILDVHLPRLSGYEVCRELRDRYGPRLPIIFLSGKRTEAFDRAAGLLIGGDDYIVKPVDPDEFLARVRRFVSAEEAWRNENPNGLTPRETEVLHLLANGHSQTDIAARLVISPKTVATHIQRVLGKLGVRSRAQAVAVAHRNRLTRR